MGKLDLYAYDKDALTAAVAASDALQQDTRAQREAAAAANAGIVEARLAGAGLLLLAFFIFFFPSRGVGLGVFCLFSFIFFACRHRSNLVTSTSQLKPLECSRSEYT